jgi:DNA-binding transcriptional LysR family regulator
VALHGGAKEGAGIVRVPSWQVEADIAAGNLQPILVAYEPPPAPINLLFQPARLTSPKARAFVDYLVERWRDADPFAKHEATRPRQ